MARAIMLQGTGSNVGKSVLVAGCAGPLCAADCVAPFKPQNMSNNASVTAMAARSAGHRRCRRGPADWSLGRI